jgi:pyruvate,water dikinase
LTPHPSIVRLRLREVTLSSFVYALEEAPEDAASVGGKALGLGRLLRAGLPVPPGFVITAEGFRAFLRETGLESALTDTGSEGPGAEAAGVLARLRAVEWPAALRADIETAYASLRERSGAVPVAARSSATAEDSSTASFAGQHATLLNLDGLDAVLDGVLGCWASLYSAEAVYYRQTRGVVDALPAMAVVVQSLVPSDAAGVAFTLDPVTGDRDVAVVEGAWGLGEGVVSGIVTPDHFAVRKSDGAIVRREIAPKRLRVVAAEGGGTETVELPPEEARAPSLSDEQAVELARLAARIEEQMGCPQDVEWSISDGRLYFLQARPITAAGLVAEPPSPPVKEPQPEEWVSEFDTETRPETIWTAANVQEVLPDQASPFSCSITLTMLERYGAKPLERTGVKLRNPDAFSAYFYGRAFLNVSLLIDVADQIPFSSPEATMEQFYGEVIGDIPPSNLTPARIARYMMVLPRMAWYTLRMPAEIRRAEKTVREMEAHPAIRAPGDLTDEQLLAALDALIPASADVSITHVSGAGITSSTFDWLRRCTRDWLDDESGALHATLCSGLASLESARPAYELWDLSRMVVASEGLRRAFEPSDPQEIEARLNALEGDAVANFRRALDDFLARHGHRSVMEADVAARSWEEDLPTVLAMLRNYLHAGDSADPRRIEERQRAEREEATRASLARLSWRQRPIFRRALSQAQQWVTMREHTKSLMVRSVYLVRRLTREIGRRAVERGLLVGAWDVYYLTWDEAKQLLRAEIDGDAARGIVQRRRGEEDRNRSVALPETFRGRPKPLRVEEQAPPEDDVLHGIAVSPGRVTAKARVILDPRRDATIEPGEILVAPVTDAGWTPLFVPAAGVVVDIGGALSHGSTVAREYGLPAVVNVKHGTKVIRTGQTITVDGSTGVVVLDGSDEG